MKFWDLSMFMNIIKKQTLIYKLICNGLRLSGYEMVENRSMNGQNGEVVPLTTFFRGFVSTSVQFAAI